MKKSIILLALALAVLLPRGAAFALTLSPPRWEVAADPGAMVTGSIILINEESETRTYYASYENFEAQGDSGTPRFIGKRDGLATWLDAPASITLSAGESRAVPFTITIPKDTEFGGYFAALFWGTTPPGTENGGQVAVGAKVGSLIFVTVGSNIEESAGLLSFNTAAKRFFYKSLPVTFEYRFANDGADRVRPVGTITVRSMLGWRVAKVDANPFQGNILPGTTRKFSPEWTKLAPDERPSEAEKKAPYSFFKAVKNEWKNFAVGFFRAKMAIEYGKTVQQLKSNNVYFIVFPFELMAILIIGTLILFFIFRRGVRRYNRWVISKAQARLVQMQQRGE
ncbi:MAG TPA: hypothetical protein VLB02_01610 [Candidatus Paceibacterota bacterium]|nr:hypothetical protein [Candidatus Paceibacterota bacterium]